MNLLSTELSRLARHCCTLAWGLGVMGSQAVWAATPYPDRAITLVVAYAPGGGVDTMGRVLAKELGIILKQSVIIDNKPGAGGAIGASNVAHAAPDGYTFFVSAGGIVTNPMIKSSMPYKEGR